MGRVHSIRTLFFGWVTTIGPVLISPAVAQPALDTIMTASGNTSECAQFQKYDVASIKSNRLLQIAFADSVTRENFHDERTQLGLRALSDAGWLASDFGALQRSRSIFSEAIKYDYKDANLTDYLYYTLNPGSVSNAAKCLDSLAGAVKATVFYNGPASGPLASKTVVLEIYTRKIAGYKGTYKLNVLGGVFTNVAGNPIPPTNHFSWRAVDAPDSATVDIRRSCKKKPNSFYEPLQVTFQSAGAQRPAILRLPPPRHVVPQFTSSWEQSPRAATAIYQGPHWAPVDTVDWSPGVLAKFDVHHVPIYDIPEPYFHSEGPRAKLPGSGIRVDQFDENHLIFSAHLATEGGSDRAELSGYVFASVIHESRDKVVDDSECP